MSSAVEEVSGGSDLAADVRDLMALVPQLLAGMKRCGRPPEPMRDAYERGRLGPRHLTALTHLVLDGEQSVGELAGRLGVSLATASLVVSELTRVGLVVRREDEADRRRTLVSVSEEHGAHIEDWFQTKADPLRRALDRMTGRQRRDFVRGMRMLVEELYTDEAGSHDACSPAASR